MNIGNRAAARALMTGIALVLFWQGAAQAQQTTEPAASGRLEEIVVTAERRESKG